MPMRLNMTLSFRAPISFSGTLGVRTRGGNVREIFSGLESGAGAGGFVAEAGRPGTAKKRNGRRFGPPAADFPKGSGPGPIRLARASAPAARTRPPAAARTAVRRSLRARTRHDRRALALHVEARAGL